MAYSSAIDRHAAMEEVRTERIELNGIQVYPFSDASELIDFAERRKGILVAVNAEKIVNANDTTRAVMNNNIAYCDGAGAVYAVRRKGGDARKIAGCELWLKIVERFHAEKTFYLVGASPEVNAATVTRLRAMYPDIRIVGARDGYLRNDAERARLIDDVAAKRPDVVFVAMGSPRQELLMADMQKRHKAIYQGLGGSFDVFTGAVRRAPRWWIDHNMEFAYRLIRQPKRFKRNLKYITFVWWLISGRI